MAQVANEMKFEFISKSANESFARATVAAFIAQLDPTISEIADIKTAISEAVTNCIVHAYKNGLGNIYYNGWGVEKDYEEAAKWFHMAGNTSMLEEMVADGLIDAA